LLPGITHAKLLMPLLLGPALLPAGTPLLLLLLLSLSDLPAAAV
jgi:hypothetical protein